MSIGTMSTIWSISRWTFRTVTLRNSPHTDGLREQQVESNRNIVALYSILLCHPYWQDLLHVSRTQSADDRRLAFWCACVWRLKPYGQMSMTQFLDGCHLQASDESSCLVRLVFWHSTFQLSAPFHVTSNQMSLMSTCKRWNLTRRATLRPLRTCTCTCTYILYIYIVHTLWSIH